MIELSPDFNLVLNLVKVVDHLHLALGVVSDGALRLKRRFMHDFHSEFSELHVFIPEVRTLLVPAGATTDDLLYFAEAAATDRFLHLELIDELLLVNLL